MERQLVEIKRVQELTELQLKQEVAKTEKLNEAKLEQKKVIADLSDELSQAKLENKKTISEHNRLVSEKVQIAKSFDAERKSVQRKQQEIEDGKNALRLSNDEVQLLLKELDALRKRESNFNRDITVLKRENAIQLNSIQAAHEKVKKGSATVHQNDIIASLEKELFVAKDEIVKQERECTRLESECDGLRSQLRLQVKDSQRLVNDINTKVDQEKILQKMVDELKQEVWVEKKKYDEQRFEMNTVIKDLKESQRTVVQQEQEKKSLERAVTTLRQQIVNKDSALSKEHYEACQEKTKREHYADEISRLKSTVAEDEDHIRTTQSEARRLSTAIRQLEDAASAQSREKEHVMHERDILGAALQRRRSEIVSLSEQVKVLQSSTHNNTLQYTERLDDIRTLNLKVQDLQRQLTISQSGHTEADSLSRNLILVQKELIRERRKVKALADDLENPLNIHRWRKLEGTDPESSEMLEKIKLLQKRLLLKSDEIVRQDIIIKEYEKRHNELEATISLQQPELAEKLNFYQDKVRKKSKQLKGAIGELNMQQTQVHEYQEENAKLIDEIERAKSIMRQHKEKRRLEQPVVNDRRHEQPLRDQSNHRVFLGGGFAIK